MKRLKLFFACLLMAVLSIGQVWATDPVQIAYGTFNGKNETYTTGWSTTGTGKSRTDCVIIGAGENITSPSVDLSQFESISITFTGRRYGTLSGSKATVNVAFGGSSIGSIDITNGSVGAVSGSVDHTITSETTGTFVFTCTNATSAGSTHGAGIGSITITGVAKSGGGGTKTLTSIAVSGTPTKTSYYAGDNFDPAGLTVTGTYSDESTAPITSGITWAYNPSQTLALNQTSIGVTATVSEITSAEYNVTGLSVTEAPTIVTFDYADYKGEGTSSSGSNYTMVKTQVSIGDTKFYGNNSYAHFYAGGVTTITPAAGVTITQIVLTASGEGYNGYQSSGTVTASAGSLDHDGVIVTWTGTADEAFTISHNKQIRWISIVVFYEQGEAPAVDKPTISGETPFLTSTTVTLTQEAADAIYYTIDEAKKENPSVDTWTVYNSASKPSFSETTTIYAAAIKGSAWSAVAEKTFTKLEPLTTMDAIFAAATTAGGTATDAAITFNNWVVTGVKNANAYVTDGTKGFIIYTTSHGFNVGDIISGTAVCKVQLYNGSAELTELPATKVTVNTGGSVSPVVLDADGIAALTGANTGSLIKISGVASESSGKYYVAGVQLFNSLYSFTNPTSGKSYDVTGVFVQYNSTKEILPRSADDIEEVAEEGAPEAPTFSLAEGTYTSVQSVELSCATDGATIYYTTDGSTPDNTKTEYTSAISVGETMTIKAIAIKNDKSSTIASATYTINLPVPVTGISLNFTELEIVIGKTKTLVATVAPNNASNKEVTWESDDEEVATVEDGVVTAIAKGAATITCKSVEDPTITAICLVGVVEPTPTGVFELYTDEITAGKYLITYGMDAMNTTVDGDRLQFAAIDSVKNCVKNPDASIVWTIAKSGDYWTLYNEDANAYAASTGAKNKAQMLADGTDDKAKWAITVDEGVYEFVNKQNHANGVNENLRKNGTYGYACYATGTGGALTLFKWREGPATSVDNTDATNKAVKFIENGQLFIELNGHIYNVQGQTVK